MDAFFMVSLLFNNFAVSGLYWALGVFHRPPCVNITDGLFDIVATLDTALTRRRRRLIGVAVRGRVECVARQRPSPMTEHVSLPCVDHDSGENASERREKNQQADVRVGRLTHEYQEKQAYIYWLNRFISFSSSISSISPTIRFVLQA